MAFEFKSLSICPSYSFVWFSKAKNISCIHSLCIVISNLIWSFNFSLMASAIWASASPTWPYTSTLNTPLCNSFSCYGFTHLLTFVSKFYISSLFSFDKMSASSCNLLITSRHLSWSIGFPISVNTFSLNCLQMRLSTMPRRYLPFLLRHSLIVSVIWCCSLKGM